ncbi:MAG: nucleotide-diphospho-sugar transferase [Flavobacteriales bacterium]
MFHTPVALFIFNRPECTRQLFSVIAVLKPSRLFIIADGPRQNNPEDEQRCAETRAIFNEINWPCEVSRRYSELNMGCRNSIPSGLNWVFGQVEECIILEDDCVPDLSFFCYCSQLLDYYRSNEQIMTIGGHRSDGPNQTEGNSYFFSKYPNIWGWATWKRSWEKFDLSMTKWAELKSTSWLTEKLKEEKYVVYWTRIFDQMEKMNTWDYAWVFSSWLNNGLSIRSSVNMISNIGFGADATHTTQDKNQYHSQKTSAISFPLKHPSAVVVDPEDEKRIEWVTFSGMHERLLENARLKIAELRGRGLER